jgi:hypothetical protein
LTQKESDESLAMITANRIIKSDIKKKNKDDDKLTQNDQSDQSNSIYSKQQFYIKTIEAVDSILKRDHLQQKTVAQKLKNKYNSPQVNKKINPNNNQSLSSSDFIENTMNTIIDSTKKKSAQLIDNLTTSIDVIVNNNIQSETNHQNLQINEQNTIPFSSTTQRQDNNTNNKTSTREIFEIYNTLKKKREEEMKENEKNLKEKEASTQNKLTEEEERNISDLIFQDLKIEKGNNNLKQPEITIQKADSNNSLASNHTLVSQRTTLSQSQCQSDDEIADFIKIDAHVIVSTNSVRNKLGHVRFIGKTKFAHGLWIGVELEQSGAGKNNGSVKNITYFECPPNQGVFVKADKLSPVLNKF